ncbi:Degenerin mec-10 [Aphelenchoides besseyi]|nr:Degenerin mec-10 [Aphelenchoides besseyi]
MSFFDRQPPLFDTKKRLGNLSGNGSVSVDRSAQPLQPDDLDSQTESWVELAPSRASLCSSVEAVMIDRDSAEASGLNRDSRLSPVSLQSPHVEFDTNMEQARLSLIKDVFPPGKNTEWIWDWSSRPETVPPNRFVMRNRGQVGSALTTPPNSPEPELASEFEFKPGKTKKWVFYRFEVLVGLVVSNLVTFVIGATVGASLLQPLDRLKTLRQQLNHRSQSAWHLMLSVVRTNGPLDLWKGLTPSSLFKQSTILDAIRSVIRDSTYRGLWKGLIPTIFRDSPFSGLYLVFYRRQIGFVEKRSGNCNPALRFGAGITSGFLACLLTQPFDVIKTVVQLYPKRYSSTFRTSLDLYKTGGYRIFFTGYTLRATKRTMTAALNWTIFDELPKMSAYRPLSDDVDVVKLARLCTKYPYVVNSNQNHQQVQCNLLLVGNGIHRDLRGSGLRSRIRFHLKQFGEKTSSHGIPWLEQAPNSFYRFQTRSLINKYNRKEKITSIHLNFESAPPFPAISLCNLNPYKDTLLRDVEEIKKILQAYQTALEQAGRLKIDDQLKDMQPSKRIKRSESSHFEAAHSKCTCEEEDDGLKCEPETHEKPSDDSDICLCAFDRTSEDAWPCFPKKTWTQKQCDSCDSHGYCVEKTEKPTNNRKSCLCQKLETFCVAYDGATEILKLWEYYGKLSSIESEVMEALGFANISDEVTLVVKARENIMFYMAELKEKERAALSTQKHQFIHKCSFNGQACDIDNDFINIADPTFGNCFVFNYNRTHPKVSSRAGANFGLRTLLYVNTSEYLPTTEAVGVRMAVHDQHEYPFPDTSGYSAPTGFVSSFGIRLAKIKRLPEPYGKCVIDSQAKDYLYQGYRYSLEGCYRSCLQEMVVKECGCGDPRFPVGNASHCQRKLPHVSGQNEAQIDKLDCKCEQACFQPSYSVSYSCANWPSESLNISVGKCELSADECIDYYKENGAFIEVFYEALNFEVLSETEAYGLVKMMADLGGQLGLWSGVSVMTCIEFVFLILEIMFMILHQYKP